MRSGTLKDPQTGEIIIDPKTKKAVLTPPRGVTALDIIKKFERSMTLEQAITYLRVLEDNDPMITRSEIESSCDNGTAVYYYKEKRRKRTKGDLE